MNLTPSTLALLVACFGCDGGSGSAGSDRGAAGATSGGDELRVLVFSRTTGYRHASIEPGIEALRQLANENGWQLSDTEETTDFSDTGLEPFDVVVFLNTTEEVLGGAEQGAMERFIRSGNGFVGVHAASDTEYDWPWYAGLMGAYVRTHPEIQEATLLVEDHEHPATAHLAGTWTRTDEWYGFARNPRPDVNVLLTLDEESYSPGESAMGDDHPIAWYHEYDGGRAFYTALGHTGESYSEPEFVAHLRGGIEWASGQ